MALWSDRLACLTAPTVLVGECTGRLVGRLQALGWGRMWIARGRNIYTYVEEPWALDNGAFRDWHAGIPFNHSVFKSVLSKARSPGRHAPLFVVAPDVPGDGSRSLPLSLEAALPGGYLPADWPRYLALQDGMTESQVAPYLHDSGRWRGRRGATFDGLFIGGTDAFKRQASKWVRFARDQGVPIHYGRCSTPRKLRACLEMGVDSLDSAFPMWTRERFELFVGIWQDGVRQGSLW